MTVFEITHLCAIEGDGIWYSRRRERWTYCTNQNWDNNKTSKGPCDTKNTSRNRTGRAISITDLRKKKGNKQVIQVLNQGNVTNSYFFVLFSPDSCHGDKWPPESFTDAFAKRGWKFIRVLFHVLFKIITWNKSSREFFLLLINYRFWSERGLTMSFQRIIE